jgi:hypothetical protein
VDRCGQMWMIVGIRNDGVARKGWLYSFFAVLQEMSIDILLSGAGSWGVRLVIFA